MVDKISIARKKELQQPDPILEGLQKGVDYVKANQKLLILVGCAILAVVIVVSGTVYSIRSSEQSASEMLAGTVNAYSGDDPVEAYKAVKDQFESILNEYPNTSAGDIARVRFADICYRAGEFDQAYGLYKAALADLKGKETGMGNLLLGALGHTCEELGKNEEAIGYFKQITQGQSALLKDEALFNLGLLYAASGDAEKSREQFQAIVSDHAGSLYVPMAEKRITAN